MRKPSKVSISFSQKNILVKLGWEFRKSHNGKISESLYLMVIASSNGNFYANISHEKTTTYVNWPVKFTKMRKTIFFGNVEYVEKKMMKIHNLANFWSPITNLEFFFPKLVTGKARKYDALRHHRLSAYA